MKMHKLLKLTKIINQKIKSLVENNEWDQILILSNTRDSQLREYFSLSPLPDEQQIISKVMIEMTQLDEKVKDIINSQKKKLIEQGLSLKKSHHAIKQYALTKTTLSDFEIAQAG